MAKKQTTAEMFALRALYRETAALLEMMAERFDNVASGATMAAQLRDLAVDVQVECSIREHPTSSVWAALQWREFGLAGFEHMLVSCPVSVPRTATSSKRRCCVSAAGRRPISARAREAAQPGLAEDAGAPIGQREKRGDRQ